MSAEHIFQIVTLGCKINQYESACLAAGLEGAGWRMAANGEAARLVIVNTCIVTKNAAHQSRQAIRKALRQNPGAQVIAAGCYAQVYPAELASIPGLGAIVGNTRKADLARGLAQGATGELPRRWVEAFDTPAAPLAPMPLVRFGERTRAVLKIQDGCESFCTYCIVPYARGPYRSLPVDGVLRALAGLAAEGYREVVLSGIHLGKYGIDLPGKIDLVHLLACIGREGFPLRVRLSSIEPNEVTPELIEVVAEAPWLCRHFHIPLQSGDDGILGRMGRGYTRAVFAERMNAIRARIPAACIGVDIMTGFPGESQATHAQTVALIRDLPVSYLHVFPFSARPGTAAHDFPGRVTPEVARRRAAELRALGVEKRRGFETACLGAEVEVLVERGLPEAEVLWEGKSDNYLTVVFPGPARVAGERVRVRVTVVDGERVRGTAVTGRPE